MLKGTKNRKSAHVITKGVLESLMEALDTSSVEDLLITKGDDFVHIVKGKKPAPAPAAPPAVAPVGTQSDSMPKKEKEGELKDAKSLEGTKDIISPDVGIFWRTKDEKSDPFVKLRDMVKVGDVVGSVDFMGIRHEIRSTIEGKIVEILIEEGQAIEYGQPLFRLK